MSLPFRLALKVGVPSALLAMFALAVPAEAALNAYRNSLSMNALTPNALHPNALLSNALNSNVLTTNALTFNSHSGNGMDLGELNGVAVEAVIVHVAD